MLKLAALACNIQKQHKPISNTVVGVVLDVTRPLYRQKQGNYIVMIKVIDESLNDIKVFGVMSKDCTVYLISKNPHQLEIVNAIGEIVLLDKFHFVLWNEIKLQTKYLGITEGLYVVDVDQNSNKLVTRAMLTMNPQLLDVSQQVLQRIKQLKIWRSIQLPKIYSPKLGIDILNCHCVMIQPFNMVLRFQEKIAQSSVNSQKMYTLMLKDLNNNSYRIRFGSENFQPGDLLMVRGIKSIGQNLQLNLTQTGNILRFTFEVNENIMNYMGIHRDNEKFITQKKQNQFTIINCESSETVYLAQLIELQDKYHHSSRKQQINIKDTYFINGVVLCFEGELSLYHREFQILLHDEFYDNLSEEEKKQCKEFKKIGYIYEGTIGIIDRSNQSKGKPFFVHLFTSDILGNFINNQYFEEAQKVIGTKQQKNARKELLKIINGKLQKISNQSTFLNPVCLALQPIRSEKLLFRVTNTKIL